MSKIITRFAPSPTGHLHIGNARTALLCYLHAKKSTGEFILRIDDTDTERSKTEFVESIKHDLEWLGLKWDKIFHQSERLDKYNKMKDKLLAEGRIYPCYETPQELEIKRKMQLKRGQPPIYDRSSLNPEKKAEYEKQDRKPHYRFLLKEEIIAWDDLIRGEVKFDSRKLSDPIIIREDDSFTYMMPSTVDDIEMNVTHVIRGEDHLTNTAIQIQIFQAIGATPPGFAHMSLLKVKDGKISKREGGFEISELKKQGIEPMTVNSFLAKIGTSETVEPVTSMAELVKGFDIKKLSRAPVNYDFADLERLNVKVFRKFSYEDIKERINQKFSNNFTREFWNKIKQNVKSLNDLNDWLEICFQFTYKRDRLPHHSELFCIAAEMLQEFPKDKEWDESIWRLWINGIQERYRNKNGKEIKGKDLFMPLRIALTNKEDGPELKDIFLFLSGYGSTANRITLRLLGTEQHMYWNGGGVI